MDWFKGKSTGNLSCSEDMTWSTLYLQALFLPKWKHSVIPFEGYEPKLRSPLGSAIMDAGGIRAQSLPVVSRSLNLGNPWYSEKTQAECELEAARPTS